MTTSLFFSYQFSFTFLFFPFSSSLLISALLRDVSPDPAQPVLSGTDDPPRGLESHLFFSQCRPCGVSPFFLLLLACPLGIHPPPSPGAIVFLLSASPLLFFPPTLIPAQIDHAPFLDVVSLFFPYRAAFFCFLTGAKEWRDPTASVIKSFLSEVSAPLTANRLSFLP